MFNLAKNTTHCLLFKINLAGNKLQYTSAKHDTNEKNISHRQNSSVIHPETRRNKG